MRKTIGDLKETRILDESDLLDASNTALTESERRWAAACAAGLAPAAGGIIRLGRPTNGGGLYVHHTSHIGFASVFWCDNHTAALEKAWLLADRLGAMISTEPAPDM